MKGVKNMVNKNVEDYLLKNFPQFIVIHTVKCFGIVNKAEIDVVLELSCFFDDPGICYLNYIEKNE